MKKLPTVLLFDNNFMIRKTFAMFAKEAQIANVIEISTNTDIKIKTISSTFDLLIVGIDEWTACLAILKEIRQGKTKNDQSIPIITMISSISGNQLNELKSININEILIKPTRIKNIQDAFLRCIESTYSV